MNDTISRAEFAAHMGVLQESDKETREDIKELTSAVKTLVETQTQSITEHRFTRKEVEEIKVDLEKFKDGVAPRIRKLETHSSNSMLRWGFLSAVVVICVSLIGFLSTSVVKPILESTLQSKNSTIVMEQQNEAIAELAKSTDATAKDMATITEIMINTYSKSKEGE